MLDVTKLVLEQGTLELARKSHRLAAARHLSAWRMSFTLREFERRDPLDLWFRFPLHERDATGLLADCKPSFGGATEARCARAEAEGLSKVAALEAVCERLLGEGAYVLRDDVRREIGWSEPTVNRWLDESTRFARCIDPATGRAAISRRRPRRSTRSTASPSMREGAKAERLPPFLGTKHSKGFDLLGAKRWRFSDLCPPKETLI